MSAKIIPATNKEGYTPEKKKYYKPKEYLTGSIEEYILERDRIWWRTESPELKQALKEKYGLKT